MKQELEYERRATSDVFSAQDEIELEATRQAQDWMEKLAEKYGGELAEKAFRNAVEEGAAE